MKEDNDDIITYNKLDIFVPNEYAIIDWERSWKKCHCGRITKFNDNWCPSCGQKLGRPELNN